MGLAPAQNQIGVMLANGDGVKRDPGTAYRWFLIAAKGGDAKAKRNADAIGKTLDASARKRAEAAAKTFKPKPPPAPPTVATRQH